MAKRGYFTKPELKVLHDQFNNTELDSEDFTAVVRIFHPWTGFEWFVYGVDPEYPDSILCYANLNDPQMAELGYCSVAELQSIRAEKESYFTPKNLKEVIDGIKAQQ